MEMVDETFVSTSAALREGYPKIFPHPHAATFQEIVEPESENSYRRKGFQMIVYYLWVYMDETPPNGANEASSASDP